MADQELKIMHQVYISKIKSAGIALIKYHCPICMTEIETRKNETSDDWSTIATCYQCERLYVKVTKANGGKVEVSLL